MVDAMSDEAARETALDPTQSFIVQAPAGSGKTELLIQRYLALLATVQQPEQVVAITFTRKAAAEMRRRVLRALRAAADDAPSERPHERTAFDLARAVIARDRELDWQVLAQPQRLRIDTLDAFNAWLARQLPVLAGGVAAADVVDKPDDLHRRGSASLRRGNRRRRGAIAVEPAHAAARRRQRLRAARSDCSPRCCRGAINGCGLLGGEAEALRAAGSRALCSGSSTTSSPQRPRCATSALLAAIGPAAAACRRRSQRRAARHALEPWLALDRPPPSGHVALAAWRGIAALLLTKQGRMAQTRRPSPRASDPSTRSCAIGCVALLEELTGSRAAARGAATVGSLPDARYTEAQWASLDALRVVLIRLAAELKVVFAERRTVDFVELALAAQRALGQVDAPSELLLALDRRIQHLLVDEFQDTSQSQRRLLELLTAGWQPDDGRTLFLVGDPMQSIYRFRDADMSLFLLAKQRGIGTVRLRSLTLQRNFRSAPAIVNWVNAAFAQVFPADDRIESGRAGVSRRAARRALLSVTSSFVRTSAGRAAGAEVARVVEILDEERAPSSGAVDRGARAEPNAPRGVARAAARARARCARRSRSTASASNRSRRTSPA